MFSLLIQDHAAGYFEMNWVHIPHLSLLFRFCSTEAFSAERGARESATKVMIVVTDGESHDGEELPDALKECEDRNITRYAIAVSPSDQVSAHHCSLTINTLF